MGRGSSGSPVLPASRPGPDCSRSSQREPPKGGGNGALWWRCRARVSRHPGSRALGVSRKAIPGRAHHHTSGSLGQFGRSRDFVAASSKGGLGTQASRHPLLFCTGDPVPSCPHPPALEFFFCLGGNYRRPPRGDPLPQVGHVPAGFTNPAV